jgi:hypothetical protein
VRPGAAGFAEWRIDILDELLKPTEAQRSKFEEFKSASSKAGGAMRSACPNEILDSMVGHMQAMEKLTAARSQAIKTVLPALGAFYATLSSGQKAILDSKEGIVASGAGMIPFRSAVTDVCPRVAVQAWV